MTMTVEKLQDSVAEGQVFERADQLPQEYVTAAARMMEFHMMSEIVGPVHEFWWVPKAPSLEAKMIFAAKSQDEVGHGLSLLRVCEDLTGKSRQDYMEEMLDGPPRFMNIFHYPWDHWADPAMVAWLIDGAEIERQSTLIKSSYGPYGRAMRKIVSEEGFHYHCGKYLISQMVDAGPSQHRQVQEALERWWPRILAMFGPPDHMSKHGATLISYGLKRSQNEALRQSWLTKFVPQIRDMGLEIPDDALAYDEEAGVWSYSTPDWEEFRSLLKGGSPVGEKLQRALKKARDRHTWFREIAYADAA